MPRQAAIFSTLCSSTVSLLTLPLAIAASACDTGSSYSPETGGSPTTSAGSSSGGSPAATAGSSGSTTTAGTGGAPTNTGGNQSTGGFITAAGMGGMPVMTKPIPCMGALPTDDVASAEFKVKAGESSLGALPHFWNTFGLGRMGLYLDGSTLAADYQAQDKQSFDKKKWSEQLKQQTLDAVKELGLNSVRGHGLFHDDIGIYREENGMPVYDFKRSDVIFDFLVTNGVEPIIELASMPKDLAADPSQTVFDWKMIVSPPKDYDRWQALVQAFVQHSVERYGADTVNKWWFEVWNEPECCGNKFWKGSLDDYFKLYDKSAAGVRAVLPNARMGGPVSSQPGELTGGSMAGKLFLEHIKTTNGPLGFFPFHSWSFLDGAIGGYFQALDLLDSYGHNAVQVSVTEFGPTWEFGLLGGSGEPAWEPQETGQGAAFVAQVYSDIAQRCAKDKKRFPNTYAWWTLSDVFDEGYEDKGDYPAEQKPFIGAMGLVSREGIKKPAYNAYQFLARMGDEQLSFTVDGPGGVGGMASRKMANGGVQVLIYNGQSPGGGFVDDKYYTVGGDKNIGVTISGLPAEKSYNVTAYRVDETHGNAFNVWDKAGKKNMSDMSDADWQAVRGAMVAPAEEVGKAVCGASFSKSFSISSPGVLLVTLEPAVEIVQ